ncbi:MAG: LabA-like NYN domain-containing protein [Dehalococcoidia bacterium]
MESAADPDAAIERGTESSDEQAIAPARQPFAFAESRVESAPEALPVLLAEPVAPIRTRRGRRRGADQAAEPDLGEAGAGSEALSEAYSAPWSENRGQTTAGAESNAASDPPEFDVAHAVDNGVSVAVNAAAKPAIEAEPAMLPIAHAVPRVAPFDQFDDDDQIDLDAPDAEEAASEADGEPEDADTDQPAARRRRRRGGRGRRGRGRGANGEPGTDENNVTADGSPPVAQQLPVILTSASPPAVSEPTASEPPQAGRPAPRFALGSAVRPAARARQPEFPSYPVDVEPLPPPTKRRPARRPGNFDDPRFTQAERDEIDRFVNVKPSAAPVGTPPAALAGLEASPLTAEEQAALAQADPQRRPRRPRKRGGEQAEAPSAPVAEVTQPTPDFAPLPAATATYAAVGSVEALLARQNVIIDTLLERQIALLRNIERSLIALERRVGGGGQTNLPRAGVYVDVPNVVYAAERIGCNIDFSKLLAMLTQGRELVRATAYAPVSDDPQMRLETQKFVQPFVDRGYRIMTKPLKRFADGTMKGNFDVEMAMDVLTMADRLDIVCLVSGDGDFTRLVEMVASKGVRVEVIAFSSSTSSELRASCDAYIDLGLRLKEICGGR